jgi:hypothetical protein
MNYIIKHGSIAALQYVITPEGKELRIVDTREHQPEFEALLENVRAAVNRQFGIIFLCLMKQDNRLLTIQYLLR